MAQSGPKKSRDAANAAAGSLQPVSMEQERERTVELLSQHFAHDNISLEELERRMERVYRATSVQALREITRDLPGDAPEAAQQRGVVRGDDSFVPELGRIVSIMAETKRRGVWTVPKSVKVWSIMADTRLDLTEAQLTQPVTEIRLRAIMASVRIIVPPGVRVVMQPSGFMSSVNDEAVDQPPLGTGAPVLRITGSVVMGELKVVVRRRELLSGESAEE